MPLPMSHVLRATVIMCGLSSVTISLAASESPNIPSSGSYTPDPEIERLIEQTADKDKSLAQKAVTRLVALGSATERALNWHFQKETTPVAKIRWARLLAQCVRGKIGYRVTLELQPDGSGNLTLWSDRAVLAECQKRYERMMGRPEPTITEDDIRRNPYSKIELLKHMRDGVKYLEGRVESFASSLSQAEQRDGESRKNGIAVIGMLSFSNFDAFSEFAESFDSGGYQMLSGSSLTDSETGMRTFRYKKLSEHDRKKLQEYVLLYYDVRWEFNLDFKGRISRNNAAKTDGSKLIWSFNCQQMLTGEALVEVNFDAAHLPRRPASSEDHALNLPAVIQADQPIAVVSQKLIHVKACKASTGQTAKELYAQRMIVDLDGRDSLPPGPALKYQWAQTFGADINQPSEALAKPRVWLKIHDKGEYRFELTVSLNGTRSKPVEVKVVVEDNVGDAVATVQKNPAPVIPLEKVEPPVKTVLEETKVPNPEIKSSSVKATGPAVDTTKDTQELRQQGTQYLKAFQYAEAKTVLSQALAQNPKDMDCAFDLGVALMESGEIPLAIIKFEEVATVTNDAKALMNIGHCYSRCNSLDEARMWYRRGTQTGKDQVAWEPLWQLGNNQLRNKDYASALKLFVDAESMAVKAHVKDPRLLRDLAVAFHGCQQDGEAAKRIQELRELGYTPNPQLSAEVQKLTPPPIPPIPEAVPINSPVLLIQPNKQSEKMTTTEEVKMTSGTATSPVKPAECIELSPPGSVQPVSHKTEPTGKILQNTPATAPPIETVAPVVEEKHAVPGKIEKVDSKPIPRVPLPPVPEDFNEAMAAGKRAFEAGVLEMKKAAKAAEETGDKNRKLTGDVTKRTVPREARRYWDEAEAMFRGAWTQKPGDADVHKAFQDLAQHAGAIALVQNTYVRSKTKGLVVLDAEASVAPKDEKGVLKSLYFVWEQTEGNDLNLRAENLVQKKVGIRISKPGIYKFELAVSDGVHGGNPVTVTVEVFE